MAQGTETKNVKVAKMVESIKTCDQYPCKFDFGDFFSFIILPLSAGEKQIFKKHFPREMGNILLLGVTMIRIWAKSFVWGHE